MSFNPAFSPSSMRLLMMPMNSPFVGNTICNLTGTMYPMYSTFKALEAKMEAADDSDKNKKMTNKKPKDDLNAWACYWAVFGCFRCIENFSDPLLFWLPYYYPAKFCVLLWLWLPQFNGASHVYKQYLKPLLQKYQPKIETVLAQLKEHEWIVEAQLPYLKMLFTSLQLAQRSAIEWLKWFFSEKDETMKTITDDSNDPPTQFPHF